MENTNTLLEAFETLLATGHTKFNYGGMDVEIGCVIGNHETLENSEVDELNKEFEEYIKSLSDEFFIEVIESFPDGELNEIQKKIDSEDINILREGIEDFMKVLKEVSAEHVSNIDEDLSKLEKEMSELVEIRESYLHVLNKSF